VQDFLMAASVQGVAEPLQAELVPDRNISRRGAISFRVLHNSLSYFPLSCYGYVFLLA
jgi:hypothetical protein